MRNVILSLAAITMLFACAPESNPSDSGSNNNGDLNTQPTVVRLTGIALTEHEITLEKGDNKVLEVKFIPENATNKTLFWWSYNTSIATVTDGVVVGVAPGTTEILTKSETLTDKCQVTVVISVTSVSLDKTELILTPGEVASLKATVLPEDTTDKLLEWSSSDETIATVNDGVVVAISEGEVTIAAKAGNHIANCVLIVLPDQAKNVITAVDLGLSVKWGSVNLGAEKPSDFGDYYAWGEVMTQYSIWDPLTWREGYSSLTAYGRKAYKWSVYNYQEWKYYVKKYRNFFVHSQSIRIEADYKTELDIEDDVAHVKLGGKWRMPTKEEWSEIVTECTWIWTTQNGVNGRLVIGKNGNDIFLPAAGIFQHAHLIGDGIYGKYWSSSLDLLVDDYYFAHCMYFYENESENVWPEDRSYGLSVRPVTE